MGGNEDSLGSGGNLGSPGPRLKAKMQEPMLEVSQTYTTGRADYEKYLLPGVEEKMIELDFTKTSLDD